MQKPNLIILVLFSFDFVYLTADLGSNVYTNECVNVLLKVKLEESALVNVNKNRCPLQINTLRCKLIYTIVKVRIVNAVSA